MNKTERINHKTGEVYGKVPEGIDVGWDYNVGREDLYKNMSNIFRGIDKTTGNNLLTKLIKNKAVLTGWLKEPTTKFLPVAKLPEDVKKALSADNDLLLLSNDTMIKEVKHHNELTADDFSQIATVLQKGAMFHSGTRGLNVVYGRYFLSIKTTKNNDENFVNSFYKANEKTISTSLQKAAKKNRLINRSAAEQ